MSTNVSIRHELAGDRPAIRHINTEAFGREDEANLVDRLRKTDAVALSLVAETRLEPVGHILFTRVHIRDDKTEKDAGFEILGLGPMAVLPDHQWQGIGSLLVETGLALCKRRECPAVVVLGHPEYYPRFGFKPANRFKIKSEYDVADEVFMARELTAGALKGVKGTAHYHREFAGV